MKNFFRKVAFGIGPNEEVPSDPLKWALNQLDDVPDLTWKGRIPSGKEMIEKHARKNLVERKKLQKKYKDDKKLLKIGIKRLDDETGLRFWPSLELSIRHTEAMYSTSPVLAKLWFFWTNHFAIVEGGYRSGFYTGPYEREIIRPNLNQTFEKLVYDVTISSAMIDSLDNSQNIGPKSKHGKKNKKSSTINENHARELLELHTVSPAAGYTQEDITQLAYIMTGWMSGYSKSTSDTLPVEFNKDRHQPGKKTVFGKTYKGGKKGLANVIKDLVNHPDCRDFIATKLCRYLITDNPTEEMKKPIIKAFKDSDGFLPEIHKAAIRVAFEYNDQYKKFQNPENWFIQMAKLADFSWPSSPTIMDLYELGRKPQSAHTRPQHKLSELGHNPYGSKQPNGFSDLEVDWISPELLIRRLVSAKDSFELTKSKNNNFKFYKNIVHKNFDNPEKIFQYLDKAKRAYEIQILLFNHPEFLRA
jgi:uncharacterized protein (DUF1800 family)